MPEIRPVLYSRELQKYLYPDNSFYKKSIQETGLADYVDHVEKPVQGSIRKAKKGEPDSLPLKVVKSTDGKLSYAAHLVYCEPLLVDTESDLMLNYSKRATKQLQQANEINTKCANIAAAAWGPTVSGNIISSTGSARTTNIVGLSGTRKAITKADFLKVYNLMLRMSVEGNWHFLATPDAYTDILSIEDFVNYEKTGNVTALQKGIVGTLFGINIMRRVTEEGHTGLLYTTDSVKKDDDDDIASTDQPANLIWNDRMVCSAEGTAKTIVNSNAPGYLGATIIECKTRFGAAIIRDDQRGVIALLEAK